MIPGIIKRRGSSTWTTLNNQNALKGNHQLGEEYGKYDLEISPWCKCKYSKAKCSGFKKLFTLSCWETALNCCCHIQVARHRNQTNWNQEIVPETQKIHSPSFSADNIRNCISCSNAAYLVLVFIDLAEVSLVTFLSNKYLLRRIYSN